MRTQFSSTGVLCTGVLLLVALNTHSLPAQQRADQSAEKSARVIERGAHHATWETVREEVDLLTGETNTVTSRYTQLETGLHYLDGTGEWVPASETIQVVPGFAEASESRHQVRWAANINTYGAVELWTPEGEYAQSHVLGLAYFDPKTRASVMIAEIQDSLGYVDGNQVVYEDAFASITAAIRYTFTKGGFEQDVIVREKLPDPAQWGFDPATVQLQVLTEFVALPESATAQTRDELLSADGVDPAVVRGTVEELEDFLRDAEVSFGEMHMTRGRAFRLNDGARESAVEVRKKLETFEGGRRILVETVDVREVSPLLEELPELSKPTASIAPSGQPRQQAALRVAPAAPDRQTADARLMDDRRARQLAVNTVTDAQRGLVIDYTLSGSTNNLTLQGDTTYYITGPVTATGVSSIEGGAIIKFANTNGAQLKLQGTYNSRTAPFRPAIFTSAHDGNIGVAISYTNAATTYYATNALWIDSNVSDLRHIHIRHAWRGIYLASGAANSHAFTHVQMFNCREGLVTAGPTFRLRNALFNNVLTNFASTASATGHVEHLTANVASILKGTTNLTLNVTNSLLVQITNASTINSSAGNATYAGSSGVFQTVGVGQHYLAASSTNRNAGVTNISLQLQLDFKEMTTYPPPNVYSNLVVTTNMVWTRDASIRDGDTPDRGYHYTAADYATYALKLDGSLLTLTNGVSVLGIDTPYFWPYNGGRIVSTGAPERMNTIGDYQAVQDGTNLWAFPFYPTFHYTIYARVPSGQSQAGASAFRFTRVPSIGDNRLVSVLSAGSVLDSMDGFVLRDSEVWRATISQYTTSIPLCLTNNLLHRSGLYQSYSSGYQNYFVNNTFVGGYITNVTFGSYWTFQNNLFDRTTISLGADPVHSHNGYITGFPQLPGGSSGNVVLTNNVAYVPGPYGDFYLGDVIVENATAALRNAGNTNANVLGLYHFTTHVNQVKETNGIVDIGYHYVAVSKADAFAASGGFSNVQGSNQWYYNYGTLLGTPSGAMTYDTGAGRWNYSSDYWTIVAQIYQHTGDNNDSIRTFRAPRSGTVLVFGSVTDGSNACGNDDGVRTRTLLNSTESLPWSHFPRYSTNALLTVPLQLSTGDYIHFQVNKNGNKDCDATVWNPVIVYLDENCLIPPEDTDADGLADYLEDANGNGTLDGGESLFADDDPDGDELPTWWERTYGFPADVTAETVRWLNFTNHVIENYDPNQDITTNSYSISNDGWQLNLRSNTWKAAAFSLTTTTNTRARMLYRSFRKTGEIQGFGLDNDKVYNNATVVLYKLAGSQNDFGNLAYDNYWSAGKPWQLYSLPVGATYPGSYTYAVFANDNDANVQTFVYFRHVVFGPDRDGDGAFDQDEFLSGTDPFNPDTDGDGVVDGWETYYAGWDIDDDGVTTAQELLDGTDPTDPDTDYDGRTDGEEILDGTNPLDPASVAQVRLGHWSFDHDFLSDTGVGPVKVFGSPPLVHSPVGKGVDLRSTGAAIGLRYAERDPDGSKTFNYRAGTIRFRFKPAWSSTNAGGTGPVAWGRLWTSGEYTSPATNGFFELDFDPSGTLLRQNIQTNSFGQSITNVALAWQSNVWHEIAFTYEADTMKYYVDGLLASQNLAYMTAGYPYTIKQGVNFWPVADIAEHYGFSLGSDSAGTQRANGVFDELEIFNYPLTSERITQEFTDALIVSSNSWKYLDNGSNQGTAWRLPGFNDSGWASGPSELGYGDGDEETVVSYGPNPSQKYITTYFRRQFVLYNRDKYENYVARFKRDDGAVVYFNGVEAFRHNLPATNITYQTLAPTGAANQYYSVAIDPGFLVEGTNTVAIEIHQQSAGSSDISMDFELYGNRRCAPAVDVALVLDRSSSMSGQKLIDAKAAAILLVSDLVYTVDQAAVVSFATNAITHMALTNSLAVITNAINAITNNSGSRIDFGINQAKAELEGVRRNTNALPIMVLLSDGKPSSGSTTNDVIAAAAAAKAAGIRIIVVGYGDASQALYNSVLLKVASAPYDYFYAPDSAQFDDVLAVVSATICRSVETFAPAVSLAPTNGTLFASSPTNIVLSATITNFLNAVTKVQFFSGTNLLHEDFSEPYSFVWESVTSGTYQLKARAHDSTTATVDSAVSQITVNAPPTVIITVPVNESSFVEVTNLVVTASATDSDGTVNEVRFYRGTNPVAFATNTTPSGSNFQITWNSRTNASYAIWARAFDNRGGSADSDIRVFTVNPTNAYPVVTLTAPANGASYRAGQQIVLTATATDSDGIQAVEFFSGTNLLTTDGSAPYSFTIPCAAEGTYRFVARATDTAGYRASSAIHTVTVGAPVLLSAEGYWDPGFMPVNVVAGQIVYHDFAEDAGGNLVGVGDLADHYNMARWSSCVWNLVASNAVVNNVVRAAESHNGGLVVGGDFATSLKYVAWWDGSDFNPLGSNVIDQATGNGVYDVQVINGNVFIGGQFGGIGGNTNIQHIAQLIGTNWVQVGNGLSGRVRAMALMQGELYIGGEFLAAGGNTNIQYLARLDGSTWAAVGTGVNGPVHALASCGANLYVGGSFAIAGGDTNANGIAIWDGERWSPIAHGVGEGLEEGFGGNTNIVESIVVRGNEVFVGGEFTKAYGLAITNVVNYVARAVFDEETGTWDWHSLRGGVMEDNSEENKKLTHVHGLYLREHSLSDGYDLIVGGRFRKAGYTNVLETPSFNIARWIVGEAECLSSNLPSVSITAPASGMSFTNTQEVSITAAASAVSPKTISNLQVFANNSVLIGSTTGTNLQFNWSTNTPMGSHTYFELTARTTDSAGQSVISAPVIIDFRPQISSPACTNDEYTVFLGAGAQQFFVLTNDLSNISPAIQKVIPLDYFIPFLGASQPAGGVASIGAGGQFIDYVPPRSRFGTDVFRYQLDASGDASAIVTIHIRAKPEVVITSPPSDPHPVGPGTNVVLSAESFDADGSVEELRLLLNGTPIGAFATNSFTTNWTSGTPGYYVFTVEAEDDHEYVTVSDPVTVVITGSSTPPVAELTELTNPISTVNDALDVTSYPTIREGRFDLPGLAHDTDDNSAYRVALFRPDDLNTLFANVTPGTLNAQGFREQEYSTESNLGPLDLTTVPNGIYLLELRVRGGGQEAVDAAYVSIDSQLKLGQFSFSEEDLVIPVNGIPLTVIRTYNSLNPVEGDFGFNWTFALNDFDVVLDEQRQIMPAFESIDAGTPADNSPIFLDVRTGGGRNVTLTLPDGRRTTFLFAPKQRAETSDALAQWSAAPGVTAKLELLDAESQSIINFFPWLHWDAADIFIPFEYHDLPGFLLTTLDGTEYELTRAPGDGEFAVDVGDGDFPFVAPRPGKLKLSKITQRSGDVIEIAEEEIVHKVAGTTPTRKITFERDDRGRITAIRDPLADESGLPSVKYVYGGVSHNLLEVHKLVDRGAGTYSTNRYFYMNPKFPHFITDIEDGAGRGIARQLYDDSGKLVGIVDAMGRTNSFVHNLTNQLEIITDRAGNSTTFAYDSRGNVTAITNALDQVTLMAYDDLGYKTNEVNALGQTNSYAYTTNGLLLASVNALGHTNAFSYDSFGQLLISLDPLGRGMTNTYDAAGNLTSVSNALGLASSLLYNSEGQLIAETDALGIVTTNLYGTHGNLDEVKVLDGATLLSSTLYGYDDNGNRTSQSVLRTLPDGSTERLTTLYIHDARGRVIHTIDPDGYTNSVGYDGAGLVKWTLDKLGRTSTNNYDARGLLLSVRNAEGKFEQYQRDFEGRVTNRLDQLNRSTKSVYDALGRLQSTIAPDNTTNTTVYDALGRVALTIDARGTTNAFGYDAAGRLVAVTNAFDTALQQVMTYAYDANGNQTNQVDALSRTTSYQYDSLNRRTNVVLADTSTISTVYDIVGRRVAETDQAANTTRFAYDGLGRLAAVTNALNAVTRYAYDETGALTNQVDALNRTNRFEYDPMGRRQRQLLPGGQSEGFGYDKVGNLIIHTNFAGLILTNSYDSLNRLTGRWYGNTNLESYAYYPTGQVSNRVDAAGTHLWIYDLRNRVRTNTTPVGTLFYQYDPGGNLTNLLSGTSGGISIGYQYDALGRLTNVVDNGLTGTKNTAYTFDVAGNLQTLKYPNGLTNLWQYDTVHRLTSLTWKVAGSQRGDFTYLLGPSGHRTNLVDNVNGTSRTFGWTHDALYRLTSETVSGGSPTGTLSYFYDAVGNRTNRTGTLGSLGAATTSVDINDWLDDNSTTNDPNAWFDANGSTRTNGANVYLYDYAQRLTNANSGAVSITYGADGTRLKKVTASATTLYLVALVNPTGYAQVVEELTVSGGTTNLSRVYTPGLDLISQRLPGVSTNFYGYDGLGSVRFLTGPAGAVTDTYAYDAYGTVVATSGSTANRYLYTGEQWDADLNTYYLRARYLNPGNGRFLTRDSYEGNQTDPLSLHRYLWVHDNPVMMIDPSGYSPLAELNATTAIRTVLFAMNAVGAISNARQTAMYSVEAFTAISDNDPWNASIATAGAVLHGGLTAANILGLKAYISSLPPPPAASAAIVGGGTARIWQFGLSNPQAKKWIFEEFIPVAGGSLGLFASKLGHEAEWELRDSHGRIKSRGTEESGAEGTSQGRLSWPEQGQTHTEWKILSELTGVKPGDIVTIRGDFPPCNPGGGGCFAVMQAFAKRNQVKVFYAIRSGQSWIIE